MTELLGRVVEITSRYNMFAPGDSVGVAVSGGADSVCLLHLLAGLASQWKLSLSVLHLDHQLRGPDSRADAEFVAALASQLDLPLHLRRLDIRALGGNLEQAAREARLAFFREIRDLDRLRCVATGHTRSDQAETILFRLLRGAGSAGLSGIRPVTHGLVRPLLDATRAEVEAWLRERNLPWREDATNYDPAFARNRIRRHLLPELAAWNPQLPETLAHLAILAQEDEEFWTPQVESALAQVSGPGSGPGRLLIQTGLLTALPAALARRVVRGAIGAVKGDLRGVDFFHIDRVLRLAAAREGHGRLQVPGVDVFRSFEWLRLAPPAPHPEERNYEYPLSLPCRLDLSPFSIEMDLVKSGSTNCDYNEKETALDWDRLVGPLVLRNWRPGDQYCPAGGAGDQKIKSLFQDSRIPLWERKHWPVITAGGQIVWAHRFGPARHCAVSPATANYLRIRIFAAVQ